MSDTIPGSQSPEQPQAVGFAAIPNWLVRTRDVSIHDKMVYLVLSSHVTRDDEWFMGHRQIATEAGMSVSSVQRSLDRLREYGLITWRGRVNPETGARLGNSYRVFSTPGQYDRPPRSEGPTPSVSVTEQKKNPEEEPREHTHESAEPKVDVVGQAFEALWTAWPKKTERRDAERRWRALSDRKRNEIIPALVAHANAYRATTPVKYIPNLATFIFKERWTEPVAVDPLANVSAAAVEKDRTIEKPVAGGKPVWVNGILRFGEAQGLVVVWDLDGNPIGYQSEDDPRPTERESL